MERYEDLENIVDTLSYLKEEINSIDLKDQIQDFLYEFEQEKDEIEEELHKEQSNYEAECYSDFDSMRI